MEVKAEPMLDDDSKTTLTDVRDRMQVSINGLKAIATSGDEGIDGQILEAEQALRMALIAINKKLGKF